MQRVVDKAQREAAWEMVDVLLGRVKQLGRGAERTAAVSAHAVELAHELFEHRGEYLDALRTLERIEADDHLDLFLAEVGRAYMQDPQRLTRTGLRSDLIVEWLEVLVDALVAVEATLSRADDLRSSAGERTDDDEAYRDAMRRKTAARWQQAS